MRGKIQTWAVERTASWASDMANASICAKSTDDDATAALAGAAAPAAAAAAADEDELKGLEDMRVWRVPSESEKVSDLITPQWGTVPATDIYHGYTHVFVRVGLRQCPRGV